MGQKPVSDEPRDAFGTYLRRQRQLTQLSLRQLAALTQASNPYLRQIERGLGSPQ
jgi:cytoskeletal protein RodZ